MMQPTHILPPYEVFWSANGRTSNFTGQFNFCRSKMQLPEPGPGKERQPPELEKHSYKMCKEETECFKVKYSKEHLTSSNPPNGTGKIKRGYCSKKKPILQK